MNHLSWRLLSCLDCRLYRARLPRCSSKNFTMTFQACWLSGTPGSTKGCAKAQWAAPSQTCSLASTPRSTSSEWAKTVLERPRSRDRKSVVEGKSVSVRVDLGGRRIITKKKKTKE